MAPVFSLPIRKIENHNIINEYSFLVKITKLKEKKTSEYKKKEDARRNSYVNSPINDSWYFSNYDDYDLSSSLNSSKSTTYCSISHIDTNNSIMEIINENQINSARANYCMKYKLYDISLFKDFKDFNYPPKYKINEKNFIFVYPDAIMTYCIAISGFIYTNNINMDYDLTNDVSEINYCIFGLFFCGKKIEIKYGKGNEIEIKECLPDVFICKDCMKKTKEKYNIKSKYLININGRVSKINKGSYHCFGHVLCGNQIEDCITKFQCKACKQLGLYSSYYLDN